MPEASFFIAASFLTIILLAFFTTFTSTIPLLIATIFSFISKGDGQAETSSSPKTVSRIVTLDPFPVIFNCVLEDIGVISNEMNPMETAIRNAGGFNQTFLVRGNHNDEDGGSAPLSGSNVETSPNDKGLKSRVSDHISLSSVIDNAGITLSTLAGAVRRKVDQT